MKSRGQTLVLFVILIPLIIMFAAFIVEDINKIKELFLKNDFEVDKLEVSFGDELRIKNENEIDSIFGKILGFDKYKIKVDITGYKNEDKIDFKE